MGYVEDLRAAVGHRALILVAAVSLLIDDQERALLIQRADDGHWGVVGGLMEPGETTEQTARREAREEIGIELGELRFLDVFSGPDFFHVYPNGDQVFGVTVAYAARYHGQELRLDPREVLQARSFALDALPSPLRKTTPWYIRRFRQAGVRL